MVFERIPLKKKDLIVIVFDDLQELALSMLSINQLEQKENTTFHHFIDMEKHEINIKMKNYMKYDLLINMIFKNYKEYMKR